MIKVTLYLIFLTMTTMIHGYDRLTGESFASRSEVIGQNGMVANQPSIGYSDWTRYS